MWTTLLFASEGPTCFSSSEKPSEEGSGASEAAADLTPVVVTLDMYLTWVPVMSPFMAPTWVPLSS